MDTQVKKLFAIIIAGLLLYVIVFLVLFSSGTSDQKGLKKIFINSNGEKITIVLSEDNEKVVLNFPDESITGLVLKKQISASGFQYVNDTYVLIGQGKKIILNANGNIIFQGREVR